MMMCSPSGFVFILIATLVSNCLHFGWAAHNSNNNNNNSGSNNDINKHINNSTYNCAPIYNDDATGRIANGVDDGTKSSRCSSGSDSSSSGSTITNHATVGGRHLRIDITRKHSVHLNGVEIDEQVLADHLADHEKELIFGKAKTNRPLKLVHLQHLTDGNAVDVVTVASASTYATLTPAQQQQNAHKTSRRSKRSYNSASAERRSGAQPPTTAQSEGVVSVKIKDNEQSVNLQLRQTTKLIDDAFVFIRRYTNSTQFIEDSHKLAERYERCFYSNENSALDLCDDENVRGVFHHNSTNYIIHPLPARFGNSTHVILESNYQLTPNATVDSTVVKPLAATVLNATLDFDHFEPEEEDFNELGIFGSQRLHGTDYSHNGGATQTTQNYTYHHNGRDKSKKYVELNLRYQPRYHHNSEQLHHQHQHQHLKHRQHLQQINKLKSHNKFHQHESKQKAHQQQVRSQQSDEIWPRYENSMAYKNNNVNQSNQRQWQRRRRRHIESVSTRSPQDLYIETAIFVDRDLFKHMSKNFPQNTESQMIRFVLAMINAVQLLYHDRSLGRRINFVLKRLEILYNDPVDLRRSDDIDTYLSNFCVWQQRLNPDLDTNPMHYDHAVILTGLDLYVVDKGGKKISQVVGLAPVAGMCSATSSCTINEGKHFESVFVVAHEIGHNLGMRHDTSEKNCDPSRYIMSPTLGSGKTTWSDCSRNYLEDFLRKSQSRCLSDHGQFVNNLDHSAEGILPGERFNADQQCMLKYGRNSQRAKNQKKSEICTDLHCQRERYTWTSHPALEGTECGDNMWCRSGNCVLRPVAVEPYPLPKLLTTVGKVGHDKANYLESSKMGHLLHEYNYNKPASWSEWGEASGCDSSCLYGPSRRLREGSTGLKTYSRNCVDHRRRCLGRDRKYEACIATQCYSLNIVLTIGEFASDKVCSRAQKSDPELTGEGVQIIGNIEESCKVFCRTKTNSTKSRRWVFPDGTTCRSKYYKPEDISYCITGRCEKFSCDNSTQNYYKMDPTFCQQRQPSTQRAEESESRRYNSVHNQRGATITANAKSIYNNNNNNNNNNIPNYTIYAPTTYRSKYENEVAMRSFHGQEREPPYNRKSDTSHPWNKYNYSLRDSQPVAQPQPPQPPPPVSASLVAASAAAATESEWIVKSGCHSSCMAKSKGIQVVTSRRTGANNIQLCTHTVKPCERLLSATEHAEHTCARYKLKVRGLSGYGTQIAASVDEPDRSCRVGCQDEFIRYRFYLVNGRYGHFPLGTKCSNTEERYCVNGKCLEFGSDKIPLQQSHISLALFRSRRSLHETKAADRAEATDLTRHGNRRRRSYLYFDPVNITETITQDFINNIVKTIMEFEQRHLEDESPMGEHIEFSNPILLPMDDVTH